MEHTIEACPFVQILDAPVPQMGDQVVELLQRIVTESLVELVQVIAVPKTSLDRIPQRSTVRRMQMAEQLVEVPTEPGYALAVVASKVFSRRELRGILSGQGSTASGSELHEQMVDIPARRGLQGFLSGQGSTASSLRRLHDDADEGIQRGGRGVSHFSPAQKKSEGHPPVECGPAGGGQLMDVRGSSRRLLR